MWIIVSDLERYLYTDWTALTYHDWAGLILTVVTFVLMAIAYFQVFRPKNKKKLESYSAMALDDELNNGGKKHE